MDFEIFCNLPPISFLKVSNHVSSAPTSFHECITSTQVYKPHNDLTRIGGTKTASSAYYEEIGMKKGTQHIETMAKKTLEHNQHLSNPCQKTWMLNDGGSGGDKFLQLNSEGKKEHAILAQGQQL